MQNIKKETTLIIYSSVKWKKSIRNITGHGQLLCF
jgi:hypothetical protein